MTDIFLIGNATSPFALVAVCDETDLVPGWSAPSAPPDDLPDEPDLSGWTIDRFEVRCTVPHVASGTFRHRQSNKTKVIPETTFPAGTTTQTVTPNTSLDDYTQIMANVRKA